MAIETTDSPIDTRISLGRAIPGQGMTTDPDNPSPWEKPPEYTELGEAAEYILGYLLEEETYLAVMETIATGTPLMDITQGLLFKGFTEGKWNPDLMMLLAESVCYILLAFAERADIDAVIYSGEEEDEEDEAAIFNTKLNMEKLNRFKKTSKIPAGALPKEIEKQLENLPAPNLLDKPEEPERIDDSLLGRI